VSEAEPDLLGRWMLRDGGIEALERLLRNVQDRVFVGVLGDRVRDRCREDGDLVDARTEGSREQGRQQQLEQPRYGRTVSVEDAR